MLHDPLKNTPRAFCAQDINYVQIDIACYYSRKKKIMSKRAEKIKERFLKRVLPPVTVACSPTPACLIHSDASDMCVHQHLWLLLISWTNDPFNENVQLLEVVHMG